jgi:hypothetical protein
MEVPMTLQFCVSPCAHTTIVRGPPDFVVRGNPDAVVRGSPDAAQAATAGLPRDAIGLADIPHSADPPRPTDEAPDFPDDDGDWEEFDPTQLESWILDDFDWDIEESYPERGDYWDDSLDREWDLAAAAIPHSEFRIPNSAPRTPHSALRTP